MSYDVWLECPCCESQINEQSWNYTCNISPMLRDAGIDIHNWNDCLARKIIPKLEKGIANLRNEPERYKEMNPKNGWGDYSGLLKHFLEPFLQVCIEHPDMVVRTWL